VDGRWRSTSVVGGEETLGPVSAHGEVQLDGGYGPARGRALFGLGHTFEPLPGLRLDVSYERVQVLGDPGAGPAQPGTTLDPVTGRSSTGGRVDGLPPFAATGVNPAGAFYPGAVSRDAFSLAGGYTSDPVEASLRLELRYDNADDRLSDTLSGVADRLQGVVAGNLAWHWTRDLSLMGRLDTLVTQNLDRHLAESLWLASSLGLAYRPVQDDRFALLLKATHLVDQRPLDLALGTSDRQVSEVLSIAPVFESPWRVGLSEKVALKRTRMQVGIGEGLRPPEALAYALLWINRLDTHATDHLDLSLEYRLLWVGAGSRGDDGSVPFQRGVEQGFVFEVAYRLGAHLRVGAGWSLTRVSDDELARFDSDGRGPFLRITGVY
jgi:hypothetical protein